MKSETGDETFPGFREVEVPVPAECPAGEKKDDALHRPIGHAVEN